MFNSSKMAIRALQAMLSAGLASLSFANLPGFAVPIHGLNPSFEAAVRKHYLEQDIILNPLPGYQLYVSKLLWHFMQPSFYRQFDFSLFNSTHPVYYLKYRKSYPPADWLNKRNTELEIFRGQASQKTPTCNSFYQSNFKHASLMHPQFGQMQICWVFGISRRSNGSQNIQYKSIFVFAMPESPRYKGLFITYTDEPSDQPPTQNALFIQTLTALTSLDRVPK